ncbi:helix-turn-helix transcriptional regulator [Planctomycetota bacterium]
MDHKKSKLDTLKDEQLVVSLKTLADMLDAHRSSVRRWLQEAGIRPIVLGRGRNGAIRYRWRDINEWLKSREDAE